MKPRFKKMKKVIFIVSVLGLLWGCKKEKFEPVNSSNEINKSIQTGFYHQPTKVEIYDTNRLFKTLLFSYNSDGLVEKIETYANSMMTDSQNFTYKNGEIQSIYTSRFQGQNSSPQYLKLLYEFTYLNGKLKTFKESFGNEIQPLEIYDFTTYHYDNLGNIKYVISDTSGLGLSELNRTDGDSISYTFKGDNNKIYYEYDQYVGKGHSKDSSKNGYQYLNKNNTVLINRTEFNIFNGLGSVSRSLFELKNNFQLSVRDEIIHCFDPSYFPNYLFNSYLGKSDFNNHFSGWRNTRQTGEYEYIVGNDGRISAMKYRYYSTGERGYVQNVKFYY
jgi:hypothetical protein